MTVRDRGVTLESTTKTALTPEALIAELPEPVRRYLQHALAEGLQTAPGVRLTMSGRIKVKLWLPFTAVQDCDGRSFVWRARVGLGPLGPLGPLAPLEVVDRYADGAGSVTGRLLGRYELFHQADEHVRRSAAGRAALEAVLAPASLLPGRGVSWRAEDDEHIVASSYLEPEQINVHMQIDSRGALRSFSARRWGDAGRHSHGYLTFGGDMHAERRFGDLVIPSHVTVGWRYGSAGYKPFLHARIRALQTHESTKSQIPLANVISAQAATEEAHKWFHGMRVGGTHIPGVISAGRFHSHGELAEATAVAAPV